MNVHKIRTSSEECLKVVTHDSIDQSIAIILEQIEGQWQIRKISEKYPKLFFDFPLFGTEKLGTSFIINSLKFTPKRERDGIYLGDVNDEKILLNKTIIESALLDFIKVVDYFGENRYKNVHTLLSITLPSDYTWLDQVWYKEQLNQLVTKLVNSKCITIGSTNLIKVGSIIECKIPYSRNIEHRKQLFPIVQSLFPLSTIEISLIDDITKLVGNFTPITGRPVEEYEFIITSEKICKLICEASDSEITELEENKDKPHIDIFRSKYFNESDSNSIAIEWVNSFLNILTDDDLTLFSSKYLIILNQHENFTPRKADMPKIDVEIDSDLKKIASLYDWDIKGELIHRSLTGRKVFQSLTQEKVLDELERINRHLLPNKMAENIKLAFVKHLKWLIRFKEENRLRQIHVFVNDSKDNEKNIQIRPLYIDDSKKLFIPQPFWESKYSYYAELVPERYILHESYSEEIAISEFIFLYEINITYSQPLILRKKRANKNEINLLLNSKESMTALCDEKGELKTYEIEYSDIPYFTNSDDNILAKTGGAYKSGRVLLRFILFQVLVEDSYFNTSGLLDGQSYSKCLWAARLKGTKWVPYKPIDENSTISGEQPSTVTIGSLIENDVELVKALNSEKTAIFLNTLGISVADIIRSYMTDANKKLQWDLTFSKLLTNNKIDPSLAQEMLEDPGLQDVYLKRKEQRESISRNQNIGFLFEKIFKQIFEAREMSDSGFNIERKPRGSDFEILYESDITDEHGEILFNIGTTLIELKATGRAVAEMTPLQGETAVKSERFVLAVLPLDNFEINEDNVKKHTRFITSIGSVLEPYYESFQSYCEEKETATVDNEIARLSIEDGQVRYQVKSDLWLQSSHDFDQFIDWIIQETVIQQ